MLVRAARAAGMPYEDLSLISIHISLFSFPRSACGAREVENEKETPFPLVFSIDRKCGHTQEKKLFAFPTFRQPIAVCFLA